MQLDQVITPQAHLGFIGLGYLVHVSPGASQPQDFR